MQACTDLRGKRPTNGEEGGWLGRPITLTVVESDGNSVVPMLYLDLNYYQRSNEMGLDQYLYAKKYTCSNNLTENERWKRMNDEFLELKKIVGDDAKHLDKNLPSISVAMKIGYWRKANAVHQWFVDNCQNGEDDCREAYVSREGLTELRDLCKEVIADHSKADELLPTQSGFFFGSTEYDEYYFSDLEETVKMIENALAMPDDWDFAYQSSW